MKFFKRLFINRYIRKIEKDFTLNEFAGRVYYDNILGEIVIEYLVYDDHFNIFLPSIHSKKSLNEARKFIFNTIKKYNFTAEDVFLKMDIV